MYETSQTYPRRCREARPQAHGEDAPPTMVLPGRIARFEEPRPLTTVEYLSAPGQQPSTVVPLPPRRPPVALPDRDGVCGALTANAGARARLGERGVESVDYDHPNLCDPVGTRVSDDEVAIGICRCRVAYAIPEGTLYPSHMKPPRWLPARTPVTPLDCESCWRRS
jgi:hypothetical protein